MTRPFAGEERAGAWAEKTFLLASGVAVQQYREQLAEQQEIVATLANIAMGGYAMESSLDRAQKATASMVAATRLPLRRR